MYDHKKEALPLEIAIGASYKLENVPLQWHITIDNLQRWKVGVKNPSDSETNIDGETSNDDITFLDNAFRHVVVGAELFPEKVFTNSKKTKLLYLAKTNKANYPYVITYIDLIGYQKIYD